MKTLSTLRWDKCLFLFENNLARFSLAFCAVGYLILLNDMAVNVLDFEEITAPSKSVLKMDVVDRLTYVFFGALLIAFGRVVYLVGRPKAIQYGPYLSDWSNYGYSELTFTDFRSMHDQICKLGAHTSYGEYSKEEWSVFSSDAIYRGASESYTQEAKVKFAKSFDYTTAKRKHENLIRSILIDRYFSDSSSRRLILLFCILTSSVGYLLFFLPNIDLVLTILAGRTW